MDIVIHDFMLEDLKLKGSELVLYAILYGAYEKAECHSTQKELALTMNETQANAGILLKKIGQKGLIERIPCTDDKRRSVYRLIETSEREVKW